MNVFEKLARNVENIDPKAKINHILESETTKKLLIRYVWNRLYDHGEYSDGEKIITDMAKAEKKYRYAERTVTGTPKFQGKIEKGQVYDRVTLSDTFSFYKSMEVQVKDTIIKIVADWKKNKGGTIVDIDMNFQTAKDFKNRVVGWTKNNIDELIREVIIPQFQKYFNEEATKGINSI